MVFPVCSDLRFHGTDANFLHRWRREAGKAQKAGRNIPRGDSDRPPHGQDGRQFVQIPEVVGPADSTAGDSEQAETVPQVPASTDFKTSKPKAEDRAS